MNITAYLLKTAVTSTDGSSLWVGIEEKLESNNFLTVCVILQSEMKSFLLQKLDCISTLFDTFIWHKSIEKIYIVNDK